MALVVTIRRGGSIRIGDNIFIKINKHGKQSNAYEVVIKAPRELVIDRIESEMFENEDSSKVKKAAP